MRIRPATKCDFPFWKHVRQEVYSGLSAEFHDLEMERILSDPALACFVAEDESNSTIGLLEVSLRNIVDGCLTTPVGYIEGIYLRPAHRGRGLGRQMVEAAAAWFRDQGCSEIAADAELDNVASQEFFSRPGFEETDRIVEFRMNL